MTNTISPPLAAAVGTASVAFDFRHRAASAAYPPSETEAPGELESGPVIDVEAMPVRRVDNATRAVAWYARLGFVTEREHQFEPVTAQSGSSAAQTESV